MPEPLSTTVKRKAPKPAALDLAPPADLPAQALDAWQTVVQAIADTGTVTRLDRPLVAAYAVTLARWREAEAKVAELGLVVRSPTGDAMKNPYLAVAEGALRQLIALGAQLGLSPAARGELKKGRQ